MTESQKLLFAGRFAEARDAAARAAGIIDYPDDHHLRGSPGECVVWAAAVAALVGAPGAASLIRRLREATEAVEREIGRGVAE